MKKLNICILISIIISASSCIQELAWNEEELDSTILVVEGLVTSENKQHFVKLSRNRGVVVSGEPAKVSGAQITISDNIQSYSLTEIEPGLYLTDSTFAGQVGTTYHLKIEVNGKVYEASDTMIEATLPKPTQIRESEFAKGFYWVEYPGNFGAEAPAKLSIQIIAPEDWLDNFPEEYELTKTWEDRLNGYEGSDSSYYLHPYLEPPAILAYGIFEIGVYPIGTEIHMSHASLSDSYYEFIRALMAETEWKGLGPFGYSPANFPTNLSNGALGYFGASHIKKYVQVIEE